MTDGHLERSPVTGGFAGGWRGDLGAVGVYLLAGVVLMARYLADPRGQVSDYLTVDSTWFEWLLAHGAYSVRHLSDPLFSMRQNVPDGVNMMANTSVLGVTIPLAPVTMLLGPKIAYMIWVVGACAGTAATTYWALSRHLVRSRVAAFLGGALAGFAPGVVYHANGQPNFVSNFVLPLIVVRVLRLGVGGRWVRDGLVLALLVTWQVFINEELLLITAGAVAVAVAAWSWQCRSEARARFRTFGAALAVTTVVAGTLCAYPFWMQFAGPQSYRTLPQFHTWGEDVASFVSLARDSIGAVGTAEGLIGRTEQNTWFGWPLTIVVTVLAALLWRISVAARTAVVVSGLFAVAALGPQIKVGGEPTYLPGPWALVSVHTPVLGLMLPGRLSYAVIGAVVVLVALGWDEAAQLGRAAAERTRPWVHDGRLARIGIVAALVPLLPVPLSTMPDARPPHFIASGAWRPYVPVGTTLVPVPLPDGHLGRETLAWSAATHQEFAVPYGYFLGPDRDGIAVMGPAGNDLTASLFTEVIATGRLPAVTASTRAAARADLVRWRAAVVVLGPQPAQAALRSLLEELLGPGQRRDDVWLWDVRQPQPRRSP